MSHRPELEAAVEAILFVTPDPVPAERLLEAFDESERDEARSAFDAVAARYAADAARGVRLEEVAGGFRIVTAAECHPYLRRFFDASGANRLSMAALETLAIVAYRQPVTAPEIQELRGKNSAAALRTLLDRRMVRITGRKEVVGRPFEYATTREFLMHFGLRALGELPPLEEFEEAFGSSEDGAPALGIPVSREHGVIGLVSTREAEDTLGSSSFGVHEHADGGTGSGDSEAGGEPDPGGEGGGEPRFGEDA
ncbi:MAG: SMC-Scp complex subunit ScpB [Thermoanaerobaculia bacterium]|nr:MAG: SMC-Scp complex subunit ScpB [Thermoanaerobaculia bacterium]